MAIVLDSYSLYIDGVPYKVESVYNGGKISPSGKISLGPAVPGMEIPWLVRRDSLVACKCLCTFVSWDQLDEQGLVTGIPIRLEDGAYLCRCIRGGDGVANLGEWSAILAEAQSVQDKFTWKDNFFWCQETVYGRLDERVVCGYHSGKYVGSGVASDTRSVSIGFRPILEPLNPAPENFKPLIGTHITLYTAKGTAIEGCVAGVSDYDLDLKSSSPLPDGCAWAQRDGDIITVDKDFLPWIKEVAP